MIRLYINTPLSLDSSIFLEKQHVHYIFHVMRKEKGDNILVFNGSDGEWCAEIAALSKKEISIVPREQTRAQKEEKRLLLAFSPLKPKRQEFLIEKATELGVTHLVPLTMRHSSIHKVNPGKMRHQAIEAAEQCERLSVPEILPLQSLESFLSTWNTDQALIIGDETHTSPPLEKQSSEDSAAFMVGPEGGFHNDEFELFKDKSFIHTVDLGNTILRAETAAIVGLALIR